MTAAIVIPVKPFDQAKARLAPVLTPEEREMLSRAFFRHVLTLATDRALDADVIVVSRCEQALGMAREAGAQAMVEQGQGQNEALEQAMELANGPVLLLSSDLPFLAMQDIAVMLTLGATTDLGIATDRAKTGTNALFLARSGMIRTRFGPDSRALHQAEAEKAGLRWTLIERPGLAFDVDRPEDLPFLHNES
ncbi:2-phospho-L-lactate guanylyltransferase [Sphingobium cloacae]|uniref:3-phospho-D-glycerate guanylyltransferase n=1 Tax=Sphingobium cloacae TaxID=120107 RepID=A0A1E1EZP4_9SPHN|nr:2-phospho-L-lactate guanylyltransferase [Sphingobium cloacae]BAV63681.1 2-phospho-L-lactate guanylyltransferase [Sphingobium cloacae]